MGLNCYKCVGKTLLPAKLDNTLSALTCNTCEGTYIDLLSYRTWLENHPTVDSESTTPQTVSAEETDNTDNALICQRCRKFMLKYRINNEHKNTINVCHTCDDVWLDRGEWSLLKYLNMQDKLTTVMSEPWQQQLRNQDREQSFKNIYQQKLSTDFDKVEDFASWLSEHPKKSDIQHYLSHYKA